MPAQPHELGACAGYDAGASVWPLSAVSGYYSGQSSSFGPQRISPIPRNSSSSSPFAAGRRKRATDTADTPGADGSRVPEAEGNDASLRAVEGVCGPEAKKIQTVIFN